VIKCALRPVTGAEHPALSAADLATLRRTFPTGVCDWAAPGVGETRGTPAWLSFGDGSRGPAGASAPVALTNVVARSATPDASVLGSAVGRVGWEGAARSGLPPTGGHSRALAGLGLLVVGIALRRRGRDRADGTSRRRRG
jgi:hypothetical protein